MYWEKGRMELLMKRRFVIAVLAIACLMGVLLVVAPIRSGSPSAGEYDPWLDWNDDSKIDMKDVSRVARAFGTNGTNVSKASLMYDSGWLDLRNETGETYTITHNLNDTDLQVDAREITTGWNKTYGTTRTSPHTMWSGTWVIQTRDSGFAVASTSDFGTGNEADWRFWLVKTDSSGNAEWNKTYGEQSALVSSIVQTIDGGYAMTGCYHIGGYPSALLVKTDSNGNMEWSRSYTEIGVAIGRALIQTVDGGYVIAGAKGDYDGWLMKTYSNGIMQWSKSFVEVNNTQLQSVVQTIDGGYIAAGATQFPPFSGKVDAYVVKTDSDGNLTWSADFSRTSGHDYGRSIVQTSDGGYAIGGETDSFGNADFWLIKTDASGNYVWDKTYGGTGWDGANSIVQTSDAGYILAGQTNSFGAGGNDLWLVKTDTDGNMQWNQTFGGTGDDWTGGAGSSVVQTLDGGYALAGYTNSFSGDGSYQVWLIKTDSSGSEIGGIESGLVWTYSSANTITLYRGATDTYWNYVRVRLWKPR
jgi:hypothetical protein